MVYGAAAGCVEASARADASSTMGFIDSTAGGATTGALEVGLDAAFGAAFGATFDAEAFTDSAGLADVSDLAGFVDLVDLAGWFGFVDALDLAGLADFVDFADVAGLADALPLGAGWLVSTSEATCFGVLRFLAGMSADLQE